MSNYKYNYYKKKRSMFNKSIKSDDANDDKNDDKDPIQIG